MRANLAAALSSWQNRTGLVEKRVPKIVSAQSVACSSIDFLIAPQSANQAVVLMQSGFPGGKLDGGRNFVARKNPAFKLRANKR